LTETFSEANALAVLLTTEGLLFAAFSFAITLARATDRVRTYPRLGFVVAGAAVGLLSLVAVGVILAWWRIFVFDGWQTGLAMQMVALIILGAAIAQPVLAVGLSVALRADE
jgi:hypothetical protein